MRFEICLPNAMEGFLSPTQFAGPKEIEQFAVAAEQLGYHALWAFDFVAPTPDMGVPDGETANWYELMTTLAYIAAKTNRIRLVIGVAVLPNREPIMLAKQVATVDQFSGGRVDFGIGLGLRAEFQAMFPRMKKVYRGELVQEKLEALQLLLRAGNEPVSYAGQHVAFDNVNLNPKPLQNPIPMLTAAETPAPLARAARSGLNPIIHSASLDERKAQFEPLLAAEGKTMDDFDLAVWADLRIDADSKVARDRYVDCEMGQFAIKFRNRTAEQIVDDNWIGSATEIAEKLIALKHQGIERLVIMHTVNRDIDEMIEQARMFAEEVMPVVEKA